MSFNSPKIISDAVLLLSVVPSFVLPEWKTRSIYINDVVEQLS